MKELVMEMLLILIQIIVVGIGGMAINWLKEKIGETNYDKSFKVVRAIVEAVEQQFGSLLGEERKRKAITMVRQRLGNRLTDEDIETLIEAAVFEMNLILKPINN
jgi:LL-H family phage holin